MQRMSVACEAGGCGILTMGEYGVVLWRALRNKWLGEEGKSRKITLITQQNPLFSAPTCTP